MLSEPISPRLELLSADPALFAPLEERTKSALLSLRISDCTDCCRAANPRFGLELAYRMGEESAMETLSFQGLNCL